jgi:ubiquinone/menaquinone biosynthesis C-methylase UbiE
MRDPRERFSDRVDDYVRCRPGYPPELIDMLVRRCALGPGRVVVDLGSGTGILSRMLLASGARVIGVEPNAAMREAAERQLGGESLFTSIDGNAEATGLPATSADIATAAQAFHWFDPARTRAELQRVLRPPGWVVLAWNLRTSTPFNDAYDTMLEQLAPEYPAVRARDRAADGTVRAFFAPREPHVERFPNAQRFDEAGLRGRLMSSSYAPKPGQPGHEPLVQRMHEIFAEHAREGHVELVYDTVAYVGTLLD